MQDNIRLSKLEKRIVTLEKIVLEKADILHKNFEGYEIPTKEEIDFMAQAELELKNDKVKSLDEIIKNLE